MQQASKHSIELVDMRLLVAITAGMREWSELYFDFVCRTASNLEGGTLADF